jgi:TP901 family phage tail tape measure protein
MLFSLNAQLGPGYGKAFKAAQDEVRSTQKEIVALNKVQGDINSYQKQQAAIEATEKKLERLNKQYKNTEEELKETGGKSSVLQNNLLNQEHQIEATRDKLAAYRERLSETGKALQEAGVDMTDFARSSADLGTKIDDLKQKQGAAADEAARLGDATSGSFGVMQQAIAAAGIAVALKETAEYFRECAAASMEFESAMTGVAKTTDLTDEEFAAVSRQIKDMATAIPATTTELAAIAEAAGQLGIAKNSLLGFTEIMAMLGTATNMTSDEAATMLAQFASITGMDPSGYSSLGSAIVALGNNYATTEKNIADMSQSIAAAGAIAGMSEADIIAVSAAVTSLGISAQNGGTQMSKLISDINSAVVSGNNLDKWARAAGLSAGEFAEAWGSDAAAGLDLFIRGLHDTYEAGGDLYSVLEGLGITETRMVTAVNSLAVSGDRLTDTLFTANAAWNENMALTAEAEKRYATTQSQMILMQNAYGNLETAIGDNFNPTLRDLYGLSADVLGEMEKFVIAHPEVVKGVTAFVGVIGLATVALTGYTVVTKAANAISAAFALSMGVALGPVVAVVAGAAALTAGIVALSEASKSWVDESWQLTAVSRAHENELRDLTAEYERLTAANGENNEEAYALQGQIANLTREYKYGKQTLQEYKDEMERVTGGYETDTEEYEAVLRDIEEKRRTAMSLISELQSMMSAGSGDLDEKTILAVINELNEKMPELGVTYDVLKNASAGYSEALRAQANAQAEELAIEAKRDRKAELAGEREAVEERKALAEENIRIAREEYDAMAKTYMAISPDAYMLDRSGSFGAARAGLEFYNEELERATADYESHKAELAELEQELGAYNEAQEAAAASGENISQKLGDIKQRVTELAASYEVAYNAALESISGQYELWDKVDKAVATSVGTINAALESQIAYWDEYNADLEILGEKTGSIEGLQEVIASFADGSKDSVNAIAGMADAAAKGDTELEKMVKLYLDLQKSQGGAADGIGDIKVGFTETMKGLKEEVEAFVADTNLSDEAYKNGMLTAEGFAQGIEDMLPTVQAAFKEMKDVSEATLKASYEINSPSRLMWELGEYVAAGFAGGIAAGKPAVQAAMNDTTGVIEAIPASGGYGGDNFTITLAPQYNLTGKETPDELRSVFAENNENLRMLVEDVLRERNVDAARRRYDLN